MFTTVMLHTCSSSVAIGRSVGLILVHCWKKSKKCGDIRRDGTGTPLLQMVNNACSSNNMPQGT
jgi:hypothetical protein